MTKALLKDRFTATEEGLRLWHRERSILEVTELVCKVMKETGVSRKELAERLGKTKGYVSQLLDGYANMTLGTVSDLFTALGYEFHPAASAIEPAGRHHGRSGRRFTFEVRFEQREDAPELEWPDEASYSGPFSSGNFAFAH